MAKRKSDGIVAKMIRLGYGLPGAGGVMFFRVGAQCSHRSDWVDMLEAISQIEYNEFDGKAVATMLGFQGDAGYLSFVEFGREYSPALYLHFNNLGASLRELASGSKKAIDAYMYALKTEFGIVPDEAGWDTSRQCLRLWWD